MSLPAALRCRSPPNRRRSTASSSASLFPCAPDRRMYLAMESNVEPRGERPGEPQTPHVELLQMQSGICRRDGLPVLSVATAMSVSTSSRNHKRPRLWTAARILATRLSASMSRTSVAKPKWRRLPRSLGGMAMRGAGLRNASAARFHARKRHACYVGSRTLFPCPRSPARRRTVSR